MKTEVQYCLSLIQQYLLSNSPYQSCNIPILVIIRYVKKSISRYVKKNISNVKKNISNPDFLSQFFHFCSNACYVKFSETFVCDLAKQMWYKPGQLCLITDSSPSTLETALEWLSGLMRDWYLADEGLISGCLILFGVHQSFWLDDTSGCHDGFRQP